MRCETEPYPCLKFLKRISFYLTKSIDVPFVLLIFFFVPLVKYYEKLTFYRKEYGNNKKCISFCISEHFCNRL